MSAMLENYRDKDGITIKEAQIIIRTGRNSIYKLIKDGKLKHIRVGKKILIPKQYLIEFLQSNT